MHIEDLEHADMGKLARTDSRDRFQAMHVAPAPHRRYYPPSTSTALLKEAHWDWSWDRR